jgi:excisionase family DNA binding protein
MIDDPSQASLPLFFSEDEPTSTERDPVPLMELETPVPDVATAPAAVSEGSPAPKLPRYYSIAEVAATFGRKPRTIRHWIATRRLRAIKIGNAVFVSKTQIDLLVPGGADWPEY